MTSLVECVHQQQVEDRHSSKIHLFWGQALGMEASLFIQKKTAMSVSLFIAMKSIWKQSCGELTGQRATVPSFPTLHLQTLTEQFWCDRFFTNPPLSQHRSSILWKLSAIRAWLKPQQTLPCYPAELDTTSVSHKSSAVVERSAVVTQTCQGQPSKVLDVCVFCQAG